jgi:hypothetical protein
MRPCRQPRPTTSPTNHSDIATKAVGEIYRATNKVGQNLCRPTCADVLCAVAVHCDALTCDSPRALTRSKQSLRLWFVAPFLWEVPYAI